ncbi:MAG: AAA family ATPase [Thaumarchaeota archaeon]|nr:AAA family ATPase [Nitrososphaerota archaeon]MCL5316844.1 AAA family ATPase [Nitrososphaerota archaeon]
MSEREEFARTGVKGVDEILANKGIPRSYVVFVIGSPGSGKTTLALQFLYNGVKDYGENGVYVSLDEEPDSLVKNAKAVGLDLSKMIKDDKIAIIDASPIRFLPGEVKLGDISVGKREFALISLIDAIKKNVERVGAKRLVVDPLATLILQYPDAAERRTAVLDLMQAIASTGCTTLLISELTTSSLYRKYQFEEFLAQGVLILRKILRPGGMLRIFTVEKMRGVDHDTQPHPYKIGDGGIEVYPSEIAL